MDEKKELGGLEGSLESAFSKLPALPESAKKAIVSWMPWVIIIVAVISLPAILAIFSIGAIFGPLSVAVGAHLGVQYYFGWILFLIAFIMEVAAIKGLMSKNISAWRMLFYATLVYAVGDLVNLSIVSLIVSTAISLYFLFQIKSYYK